MTKHTYKRRILLIQWQVQLAIIGYAVACSILSSFFTLTLSAYWQRAGFVAGDWKWIVLIGGGLCLFIFLVTLGMYLTNRICGPLFQLHKQMQLALKGEEAKVYTRKGDYFGPLIEDSNTLFTLLREREGNGKN